MVIFTFIIGLVVGLGIHIAIDLLNYARELLKNRQSRLKDEN